MDTEEERIRVDHVTSLRRLHDSVAETRNKGLFRVGQDGLLKETFDLCPCNGLYTKQASASVYRNTWIDGSHLTNLLHHDKKGNELDIGSPLRLPASILRIHSPDAKTHGLGDWLC